MPRERERVRQIADRQRGMIIECNLINWIDGRFAMFSDQRLEHVRLILQLLLNHADEVRPSQAKPSQA